MMNKPISLEYIEKHMIKDCANLDNTWNLSKLFISLGIPYNVEDINNIDIRDLDIKCYWYYCYFVNDQNLGIVDKEGVRTYFLKDTLVAMSFVYCDGVEEIFWISDRFEGAMEYLKSLIKPDYSHIRKYSIDCTMNSHYTVDDCNELSSENLNAISNAYYMDKKVKICKFNTDPNHPMCKPTVDIQTEEGIITVPIKNVEFKCNFTD